MGWFCFRYWVYSMYLKMFLFVGGKWWFNNWQGSSPHISWNAHRRMLWHQDWSLSRWRTRMEIAETGSYNNCKFVLLISIKHVCTARSKKCDTMWYPGPKPFWQLKSFFWPTDHLKRKATAQADVSNVCMHGYNTLYLYDIPIMQINIDPKITNV